MKVARTLVSAVSTLMWTRVDWTPHHLVSTRVWTRQTRVSALLCLVAFSLPAEIVDRIAVTVGNQVITESALLREIQLTAFLNGEKPDYSADSKRKAADRLIEQKLVRKEMAVERAPTPTTAEADAMLAEVEKQRPPSALSQMGLTPDDLKDHLVWQTELLRFVDFRFRPAVQVADADIQKYYQEHFQNTPSKPALDTVRDEIIQRLTEQSADRQMDGWLRYTRRHTRIEFHEEVFQ